MSWRGAKGRFQPLGDTFADRYPRIFDFVASQLPEGRPARILSFGCSTGEEVFTLRRRFPAAAVRGLDINPGAIAVCRRRLARQPDPLASFAVAGSSEAEPSGGYDAIFCMAVLRDGRLTQADLTCSHRLRFADFARVVQDFHRCLRPGGLLAVRHCNFRVCDAPAGAGFEPVLSLPVRRPGATPVYGPNERLMPGAGYAELVFRKRQV
jgi:trans-aconitate methyltransferase